MRIIRYLLVGMIGVFLLSSCVTPKASKLSYKKLKKYKTTKQLKPKPKDNVNLTASNGIAPTPQVTNVEAALLRFIATYSDPNSTLTPEDENLMTQINITQDRGVTPIKEAVVVLGTAKKVMKDPSVSSFKEEDLLNNANHQEAKTPTVSLEDTCVSLGVNLPKALSENPFLQSYNINNLILTATQNTTNSPQFTQQIKAIILKKSTLWADLPQNGVQVEHNVLEQYDSNQYNGDQQNSETAGEFFEPQQMQLPVVNSTLSEAQALADSNKYKQAIDKAAQVQEGTDYYDEAQQKILTFSTIAVQELRRKAADAFQNSLPVNDPKIKMTYLEEAQKYLETALSDYPQAPEEQLVTVKQNLAIINRDLNAAKAYASSTETSEEEVDSSENEF